MLVDKKRIARQARWFLLSLLLLAAALVIVPGEEAQGEPTCVEAILIWSWAHMDWVCSASDGGGQICILCYEPGPGSGPKHQT
ncbi:MAG: hypothetical protein SX243_23950 [Acidobacteriota bacterium]|nr:hypothetical protein [Acidobacteriota bacterium]